VEPKVPVIMPVYLLPFILVKKRSCLCSPGHLPSLLQTETVDGVGALVLGTAPAVFAICTCGNLGNGNVSEMEGPDKGVYLSIFQFVQETGPLVAFLQRTRLVSMINEKEGIIGFLLY